VGVPLDNMRRTLQELGAPRGANQAEVSEGKASFGEQKNTKSFFNVEPWALSATTPTAPAEPKLLHLFFEPRPLAASCVLRAVLCEGVFGQWKYS
jgi:hypothetical protein